MASYEIRTRRFSRLEYERFNLVDRVLEIHREPARPGPTQPRWGYAVIEVRRTDAAITPLAAPSASIRVADFLP